MVTAKGPGVATPVRTCFAVTLLCAIAVSLSQIALLRTFVRENNAADVTRVEDSVTRVLAYESKGRALEVELTEGNHNEFRASEVLLEVENFHHQAFQNSSDPQNGVVGSSFVTITSQTSISRISRVPEICRRWKGPIVVSFFREGNQSLDEGMRRLIREECNDIRLMTYEFSELHKDDWYPVNTLRNKAREAAQTSHYLMIDIDMLPSMVQGPFFCQWAFHFNPPFFTTEKPPSTDARNYSKRFRILKKRSEATRFWSSPLLIDHDGIKTRHIFH